MISIIDSWSKNMPSSRITTSITASIAQGDQWKETNQSIMPPDAPENARICAKVVDAAMMRKVMPVTFIASSSDFQTTLHEKRR